MLFNPGTIVATPGALELAEQGIDLALSKDAGAPGVHPECPPFGAVDRAGGAGEYEGGEHCHGGNDQARGGASPTGGGRVLAVTTGVHGDFRTCLGYAPRLPLPHPKKAPHPGGGLIAQCPQHAVPGVGGNNGPARNGH